MKPYDPSRQARSVCEALAEHGGYATIGRALVDAYNAGRERRPLLPFLPPPERADRPTPEAAAEWQKLLRRMRQPLAGPRGPLP